MKGNITTDKKKKKKKTVINVCDWKENAKSIWMISLVAFTQLNNLANWTQSKTSYIILKWIQHKF